jgi:hypothetical protein
MRSPGPRRAPRQGGRAKNQFYEELDYNNVFFMKKRDPIFAGMLSWYVPGLGQYYSGQYVKARSFL